MSQPEFEQDDPEEPAAAEVDSAMASTIYEPPPLGADEGDDTATVAPPSAPPTKPQVRAPPKITTALPRMGDMRGQGDLERVGALSRLRGGRSRRYRVDAEIGRGAMGKVLRVGDADLNRQVAMKVLMGHDEQAVIRFVEEAQISSQLQHPGVLPVYDFGVDAQGDFFFTMQLADGCEPLGDVIDRLRAGDPATFELFTFERRVELIQRVCRALHYAHDRGVVHRDIKPDNIVVGQNGEVWLVDWGIASVALSGHDTEAPVTLGTTDSGLVSAVPLAEGSVAGTPRYMAPEQIMGLTHQVDSVTDVYSLVAVLYEFLCLHHYLGSSSKRFSTLVVAITTDTPPKAESFFHDLNGRVPRHLSRFCRKGLTKAKAGRYQSALELERDLQAWLEGTAPIVCPGTAMQAGLCRCSDVIDHAPVLVPAMTIVAGVVLLGWVGYASLVAVGVL